MQVIGGEIKIDQVETLKEPILRNPERKNMTKLIKTL